MPVSRETLIDVRHELRDGAMRSMALAIVGKPNAFDRPGDRFSDGAAPA